MVTSNAMVFVSGWARTCVIVTERRVDKLVNRTTNIDVPNLLELNAHTTRGVFGFADNSQTGCRCDGSSCGCVHTSAGCVQTSTGCFSAVVPWSSLMPGPW